MIIDIIAGYLISNSRNYSGPAVSLPMFQLVQRSLKNCNWNWSIEGLPLFTGESYCWTFKLLIVWLEERSQSPID